ncbi:tetratricopeptide repeat protein [bacterium]|jgi:tetratricopeptide (TPR) repeat protein|nr:tetratricopeptide repeat protein [bacterium]
MRICLFLFFITLSQAQNRIPLLGSETFASVWGSKLEGAYRNLKSQDFIAAKQKLHDLLESPHRPAVLYYMAQVYLELDQIDRAFEFLGLLQKEEGFPRAIRHCKASYNVALGRYFLRRRKWAQASTLFEGALKEDPDPRIRTAISEIYLDRVKFMRKGKDLDRKLRLLTRSHKLNPNHELTLQELSSYYLEDNQFNQAEKYLETLAHRFPNRDRLYQLSILYTYTDRIRDSMKILTRLKAEYPEDPEVLEKFLQVRQFLTLQGDETGELLPSDSPTEDPSSQETEEDSPQGKLQEMYLAGDWMKARSYLSRLRQEQPDEWKWVAETIQFYLLQKKQNQAIEFLKAQIPIFGDTFEFKLQYSQVLQEIDSNQALEFVSQEINANLYSKTQVNRLREIQGKQYLKMGRLETAREIFEELLLTKGPRIHISQFYLGVYYSQKKYFQKALEYFQTANQSSPSNPKYLLALATTFRQLGLQSRASEYVKRLKKDFPDSKYTGYARQIFQSDAPDKDLKEGSVTETESAVSAYWRTFRFLNDNPDQEKVEDMIPLLKATRQWDFLTQVLESYLKENPNRPSLEKELESLYANYANLDFEYSMRSLASIKEISDLRVQKRHSEILKFYKSLPSAVSLAPKLQLEFVRSFLDMKEYELAQKLLSRLLVEGQEIIEYHSLMGYSFFMQKRFDDALNSYYQALSLEPSNVALLFKLAELLKTTGQTQKARLVYQEIIKLNVDDKSVQDARFFYRQLETIPNSPGRG